MGQYFARLTHGNPDDIVDFAHVRAVHRAERVQQMFGVVGGNRAIQYNVCLVSAVQSCECRVFLPSSDNGYSTSHRYGPSLTGDPVSSPISRTAACRCVSFCSSLPFGQLQSSYFGRCTIHTSMLSSCSCADLLLAIAGSFAISLPAFHRHTMPPAASTMRLIFSLILSYSRLGRAGGGA